MNFLINAAFEDAAFVRGLFIRGRRLINFSFPKCGVYKRAAFKRGNTVNEKTDLTKVNTFYPE